jgi:putative endonuclease
MLWFVYIVRCADDSLYTGIAKDVARRVGEHNATGRLGANYTRARRPVALVYTEAVESRSAAARREHEIKQMTRLGKDELLKASRLPNPTKNAVPDGEPEAAAGVWRLS